MRRRRTRVLSAEGIVAFALIPGFLTIGALILSRMLIVASHCVVSSGYCP